MKSKITIKAAIIMMTVLVFASCKKNEVKPLLDQYDLTETSLYPEVTINLENSIICNNFIVTKQTLWKFQLYK